MVKGHRSGCGQSFFKGQSKIQSCLIFAEYTPTLFVAFYNNCIYNYNLFQEEIFLCISVESNTMFGIRISSIELSKQ